MKFELLLADESIVTWEGEDGIDAARRYVDVFRDATVIAWRYADSHGIIAGLRPILQEPER